MTTTATSAHGPDPASAGTRPRGVAPAVVPRASSRFTQASSVLPPRFAVLEMSLLVVLIVLEYLWEGFPSLTRFNPHPYWIAVLLLSLQYGTVSGLVTASIAIIGTVLIGMPEPDIEERYFNYLIRVWTQPVLWLLVALLLGAFRARQIEQRDELLEQVENLRMRGATLLDHSNNLRARCTMLERSLAMRETVDTGQLLASLARLGDAEPGRWARSLHAALDAGFPKSQVSLYAVDGSGARLVLSHQRSLGDAAPAPVAELAINHPLFAAVVTAGRSVSVIEPADDAALRGIGVAAVPVLASDARVIGLLMADVLPASQIDASTTRRLSVVAAFLAPALQRGLLSSVAGVDPSASGDGGNRTSKSGRAVSAMPALAAVTPDSDPAVRRWRLLNWLPGRRAQMIDRTEGNDG